MAANELALCNLALTMIGQPEVATLVGTTKVIKALNRFYAPLRDEMLVSHPWNFALKRASLTLGGMSAATVVDAGAGGTPGAVTLTGTTGEGTVFQATGTINGGGVLAGALVVSVAGAYTTVPDDLAAEPVTGGGLEGATVALTRVTAQPVWEWSAAYDLPADCLKLWKARVDRSNRARPWQVEGRQILTDMGAPLLVQYIRQVTDTTLFSPLFDTTLAKRMAQELAMPIAQSESLKADMGKDFEAALKRARTADAQEGTPEPPRGSEIIAAMRS